MKLAILSGTFNPIHKSHIAIAKYVKENFTYDKLLLIPAFIPPFKEKNTDMSMHRFNMVKDICNKYNKQFVPRVYKEFLQINKIDKPAEQWAKT